MAVVGPLATARARAARRSGEAGGARGLEGNSLEGNGLELTTVADDLAVLHDGARVAVHGDLAPDTDYSFDGVGVRTLPRPPGARLATVATVNDLHLGETVCGVMDGVELGPALQAQPGEAPYPETMSMAAAAEIAACAPDAVVAKGDLTAHGTASELRAFLDCFAAVGDRLHYVRGNHDAAPESDGSVTTPPVDEVALPGVVLALLDTAVAGQASGTLSVEQLDWLDELGARSDRPVLVFGHHHVCAPRPEQGGEGAGGSDGRPADFFGIDSDDSELLVEVFSRRPMLVGYFAGHTHRNRVLRFPATGDVPWVEVSAVKDFPGAWAEYRVYEGGILQVFRRISSPRALDWSERTRAMFAGLYPAYSFGAITDRCFPIWPRDRRLA